MSAANHVSSSNQHNINIPTGLINNGNECFSNSVLQVLSRTDFIHLFLKKYNTEDIKIISIINKYGLGKVKADEMSNTIKQLLDTNIDINNEDKNILNHIAKHACDIFIYTCFKAIINNLHSRKHKMSSCSTLISVGRAITESPGNDTYAHLFNGEQNDPHEFMTFLLDTMHKAKANKAVIALPANYENMDPYFKLYFTHIKTVYQNDFSMFVKNFYYYILNCIECSKCNKQYLDICSNGIMCVPMPLNWESNNNIKLEECIHEMFKVEGIDYTCANCGNNQNNRIDRKLLTKPKTLIITIKRYGKIGKILAKINKMIHYPETMNLHKYFCGIKMEDYHLYAIINHVGQLGGGHYYSYVKDYNKEHQYENKWYVCNDANVQEIPFENVMSSNNAYMLFYHSNN